MIKSQFLYASDSIKIAASLIIYGAFCLDVYDLKSSVTFG